MADMKRETNGNGADFREMLEMFMEWHRLHHSAVTPNSRIADARA